MRRTDREVFKTANLISSSARKSSPMMSGQMSILPTDAVLVQRETLTYSKYKLPALEQQHVAV